MSEQVEVEYLAQCDFCGNTAKYDGKTRQGPWAYMCERHWRINGVGRLGTGYGQELVLRADQVLPTQDAAGRTL